jgi:uncharacterized protein involved in exopolysaccharide biosynthesis
MNSEELPIVSAKNSDALFMASEAPLVAEPGESPDQAGMNIHDVLFMLFRHKWKIIFCTFAGLLASGGAYFLVPRAYQSQAKLLVRYVVEHSAVDGLDPQIKTPTPENHTLINSEVEILTSSDLVRQVVESVGIDRLPVPSDRSSIDKAVEYIYGHLAVEVVRDTNIIAITFQSTDQDLPMPVVKELVKRYFDKHLEVHRSTGAFNFVERETADLKKELGATEAELKSLKDGSGIISLTEAKADLAAELGKTQQELDTAESDFAAQQARVKGLETSLGVRETQTAQTPVQPVSGDILEQYKSVAARLTELQKAKNELLLKYTPESPMVKVKTNQIAELEKQRSDLEKNYPALVNAVAATSVVSQGAQPNIGSERAVLAGLESKVEALKARMSQLQARAKAISEVAPRIEELETKKEVEETNYKRSEGSLQKARIDETLDPSRMPNISVVETPVPAIPVGRNLGRLVAGLAGGGLAVGVAIALLIELVLDRTVKRSTDFEDRLRVPLLLSIPYVSPSSRRLLDVGRSPADAVNGTAAGSALEDIDNELQPFCAAIRDRLGMFFQVNNMSYKPKLVAVTGMGKSAGASTLASGLADALSEASDGKVLLVNKVISTKGFYHMVEDFRRSDLDYVVFDMPSLGDVSSTLPLAGFMDKVLLVVEAEKSSPNAVKRAYAQLAARTKVSVVFNKMRTYGPRWLEKDI